jgi:hypothetical protein
MAYMEMTSSQIMMTGCKMFGISVEKVVRWRPCCNISVCWEGNGVSQGFRNCWQVVYGEYAKQYLCTKLLKM